MNKHTKRFIASSFFYFFFGCSLGVLATLRPDLVGAIRPIHSHINLLGWVTMMIIGVSYFVIPVFVGKHPYSDRAVTLHFILANIGILGMAAAFFTGDYTNLSIFSSIEVLSAYLFLFNIISTAVKGAPVEHAPPEWTFLTGAANKEVDRWASYFTQAATLYFVIGCTLGGYMALSPAGWSYLRVHFHMNMLGWITMMIYGVAYHVFPRFSGRDVRVISYVKINFIIANAGLLCMVASLIYAEKSGGTPFLHYMIAFSGILEAAAALIFVYNILPAVSGAFDIMGRASVRFVSASLSYFIIGAVVGLFMAVRPDYADGFMPLHAHLNTLGWITMMIYGVGYYMIPKFAGKDLYSQGLAALSFWTANAGLIGFLVILPLRDKVSPVLHGFFAGLELVAAFIFIFNIAKSLAAKE